MPSIWLVFQASCKSLIASMRGGDWIEMKKTIGILGGMGPMATIDLFQKIVAQTPAVCDQDHLKIIIYNNPSIPSRNQLSVPGAADPFEEMVKSAALLEQSGADFIVMPCHAAHYWHSRLQHNLKIPLISMIDTTVEYLASSHAADSLLLGNTTTIEQKIYEAPLAKAGLSCFHFKEQPVLVDLITSIKAGHLTNNPLISKLNKALAGYEKAGITVLIAACTEIPLISSQLPASFTIVDPTWLLAKKAISMAMTPS